jgi:uncharacterized protein YqjF (DUF2071 family)
VSEQQQQGRRLPFAMRTVFQDLLMLTYAVAPDRLAAQLPPWIHPFVHECGDSYVSIIVGNMRGMRAGVLPEFLGTNYYQIVYRAVVRLRDAESGEDRPGVFFLRSDSNDPVMSYFGNLLTEFRFHYFHTGAIGLFRRGGEVLVTVQTQDRGGDLVMHLRDDGDAGRWPPAEGFATVWQEKQLLVELFHAFAHDAARDVVHDLEIERGEWHLSRLRLADGFSAFFEEGPFTAMDARPVSHLYIRECSYVWKPMTSIGTGRLLQWGEGGGPSASAR